MIYIILGVLFAVLIHYIFKVARFKFDYTKEKDLLLWYNTISGERVFIFIIKKN
jgi:hypothetical protein